MKRLRRFFGVYLQIKTYLYLVYLLLAFPLGLIYFVVLVTGFSTGFAMTLLLIGLLILFATLALARFFTQIERKMAIWLLRIPTMKHETDGFSEEEAPWFKKMVKSFRQPQTWMGLLYLMLKLPIGIVSFSVAVVLLASSFGLLASPFSYRIWENHFWGPGILFWKIDTLMEGIIGCILGFILLTISLNITNYLGALLGAFTRWMLKTPDKPDLPAK